MPDPLLGTGWRTWRAAMAEALYGEGGFYRRSGAPAAHFRTAAHVSPAWAAAWAELARRVHDALGRPADFAVVDIGAGGGELLAAMSERLPAAWRLVAVEVAPRPASAPPRVEWRPEPPASIAGLIIAVEWLDVVPIDIAAMTESGPRLLEVDVAGTERTGGAAQGRDLDWLRRWWPMRDVGDRAEIGWPRDDAWASALRSLSRGVAVAVDYAAVPERDTAGTMAGYRAGRQVQPVPDASCDITAHVRLEACAAAATADGTTMLSQRDALRALGVQGQRPTFAGDTSAYLMALNSAGEAAELLDPQGLGGFTWLVQTKGCDLDGLGLA